jgi:heptosyltransferase-2
MKFLIIQTAFIGDVVLATPLVEQLRQHFPWATIDFLLRKGNESLLDNHPHIRKVFIFNKKEKKYRNLLTLIGQIRKEKYDYVINAQRFFASGLITVLSGAKQTIGFDKNPLSFFFSKKIKHHISAHDLGNHEVKRNLSLIAHLTDDHFVKPRLYPSDADFEKVKSETPYICIAPTSVWFTKQYPADRWIDFLNHIQQPIKVYLLGSKGDFQTCETIKSAIRNPQFAIHNLAGQLTFLESAALMKGAVMNYVNDSAPLHFASAVNAPVTAIFCSTVPEFGFGPLSDESHVVETKLTLSCRPCGLHGKKACPKGHFKCSHIHLKHMVNTLFPSP